MRDYAFKRNTRCSDALMRINDRAMMRKLIRDNRRQRAIIRRYQDAFEIKDIASKLLGLVTGALSKAKDKATTLALRAVLKILSKMPSKPVGPAIKNWAKMLFQKLKFLAKSELPSVIGNQLVRLGEWLVNKAQQAQGPVNGDGAYI